MIELRGSLGTATVMTDNISSNAISQIVSLLNEPLAKDSTNIVMPDVCESEGVVTGMSMKYDKIDKLCPKIIGSDISCGVLIRQINIKKFTEKTFKKLDKFIYANVPTGAETFKQINKLSEKIIKNLTFDLGKNEYKILGSLGTLGGGNHFIEVGFYKNEFYLSVHTGSRNLGTQVFTHHMDIAYSQFSKTDAISKNFSYLENSLLDNYISDFNICNEFAKQNRKHILDSICYYMGWDVIDEFDSVHNFIDFNDMTVRKGTISAHDKERQVIPLNRADGLLLVTGKGNMLWNQSAPHGSGRKYSRSKAKEIGNMDIYNKKMKGIYSSTVTKSNIDEAPTVYKNSKQIMIEIEDTVTIDKIVKPIYSLKTNKNTGKGN